MIKNVKILDIDRNEMLDEVEIADMISYWFSDDQIAFMAEAGKVSVVRDFQVFWN